MILVPVLVVLFFYLSEWQRERYDGRNDANAVLEQTLEMPTAQLQDVLAETPPGSSPAQWRQVTAQGTYLPDKEVLVRKKPMQGKVGFWVITPLHLTVTTGSSPHIVLVNRGWIPPATTPNTAPSVPPPPSGEVAITGRLQDMQQAEVLPDDLPAGQILSVNPSELNLPTGKRVASAYINLQASNPPQSGDITVMPEPEIDSGPHLSYALQWIAFALVLIIGIVILVRREARFQESEDNAEDSAE